MLTQLNNCEILLIDDHKSKPAKCVFAIVRESKKLRNSLISHLFFSGVFIIIYLIHTHNGIQDI